MTKTQSHIIQKVNWQITLSSERNERRICDQVKDEFYRFVQRELSLNWDEKVSPTEHVVIDKVEIDLGTLQKKDLRKVLLKKFNVHFKEMIELKTQRSWSFQANSQIRNELNSKNALEAFDHFLENGNLPWWFSSFDKNLVEEIIALAASNKIKNLTQTWSKIHWTNLKIERLLHQFRMDELIKLLSLVYDLPKKPINEIRVEVEKVLSKTAKKKQRKLLRLIVVGFLTSEKTMIRSFVHSKRKTSQLKKSVGGFHADVIERVANLIKDENVDSSWLQEIVNERNTPKIEKGKTTNKELTELTKSEQNYLNKELNDILSFGMEKERDDNSNEALYVQGAGAVLLWPYLNELFKELKWINDGSFTSKTKQRKAVQLIHFMTTGKKHAPEYEMTMSKLLCGWKLKKPLKRKEKLKKKYKKLGMQLLKAAVENWSALKSTTTKGLQQSFLQREGKLEKQGPDWKLTVEKQSYDVLLSQLPWGYSIIKLPWNNYLIKVDW